MRLRFLSVRFYYEALRFSISNTVRDFADAIPFPGFGFGARVGVGFRL